MILRQAVSADAPAITALWNRIIAQTTITFTDVPRTDAAIAADIAARGPAFVVAMDGVRLLGLATYAPFRAGPGYAQTMEHSVHLDPDAQGRGIGRALMHRIEDQANAAGIHAFVAGISGENPRAVAFHSAIGYREVGRLPGVGQKFGRRIDLVLMHKTLETPG